MIQSSFCTSNSNKIFVFTVSFYTHFKAFFPFQMQENPFFKRGLERNCKNKNVIEFEIENIKLILSLLEKKRLD